MRADFSLGIMSVTFFQVPAYHTPWRVRFSTLDGGTRHYCVSPRDGSLCSSQGVLSPFLDSFLTHKPDSTHLETWEPSDVSAALHTALFSPVLCPVNSTCLGIPSSVLSIHGRAPPGFPPPAPWPGKSLGSKLGQGWGLPRLFSTSQGSLPCVAWCPISENHCFLYFVQFFSCFRWL